MEIKKRRDRVNYVNSRGEISVPIGHYVLKNNSKVLGDLHPKIIIYGLGSCVALILFDKKAHIYAMSHILLPSFHNLHENKPLRYPHKYADRSVEDLIREVIAKRATKKNLKAVIVGGAKIFKNHYSNIGEENVNVNVSPVDDFVPLT